jgi:hypothetical protein
MNGDKDQSIAKILEDSRDMVKRFESLVGKDQVEQISLDVQKETIEDLDQTLEPAADAYFDLYIEDDAMTVTAEFRPPAGGGKPLDLDVVEKAFFDKGVAHGILWDAVRTSLDRCNLDLQHLTGTVLARGTPPVSFVPAHVELEPRWTQTKAPEPDQVRDVNFKEITPFVMVTRGDLLAHRVADAYGSPGTDVLGRQVPYPTTAVPTWAPGPNVTDTPVGYEAAVDGRLVLTPPTFQVNPVLELTEGVDYKTGNIRFKGEVILKGRVSAGFSIEAGGSLSAADVIDAFQVKTGGDLTTPGGVIGNGAGRVEAEGGVAVKFLEHVYLLAQGDVRAEACILNSVVKTRGKVVLGEKGIVAGGQIHSLSGLDVFQIGTPTGPRTELHLGLDFQGMEKILWIRERSKELHAQLKKVDAAIPYGGTRVRELMAAAKKIRVEIVQLTETARKQLVSLGQDETAAVVVRGSVFPGTLVEICHVQFLVTQKMSKVRFFLDKKKGTVGVEPLTPETATHSATPTKKH